MEAKAKRYGNLDEPFYRCILPHHLLKMLPSPFTMASLRTLPPLAAAPAQAQSGVGAGSFNML